jgi:hypothetical protein
MLGGWHTKTSAPAGLRLRSSAFARGWSTGCGVGRTSPTHSAMACSWLTGVPSQKRQTRLLIHGWLLISRARWSACQTPLAKIIEMG